MPRGGRVVGCGVLAAVAVIAFTAGPRAQAPSTPTIAIRISSASDALRPRIEMAAKEAARTYVEALGAAPVAQIIITDDPTASGAAIVSIPWRSAADTMEVESATAFAIARLWWRTGDPPADRAFSNGVSWYLQSRVVETLYDYAFHNPGHSADGVRFFGGAVPWSFPTLRMSRWTAGVPRSAWLGSRHWPQSAHRLPREMDPPAVRVALAMAALERTAGWPALQGALAEAAQRGPASARTRIEVMSAALGFDLSTVSNAIEGNSSVDYSIADVTTNTCEPPSCYSSKVMLARWGDPRAGTDRLRVRAEFKGGEPFETTVDGNAGSVMVEFESAFPLAAVRLDPDGTVATDVDKLNDDWLAAPATNVPVSKWVARWMLWLEDAALTYSALF